MNFTVSTVLSAFAASAFLPGFVAAAHADEKSDLFNQRLLTDACVKRGAAEPQKRIAACSELIAHAKHAAPEMALAFLNRAAAYKALNDPGRAAADYAEALRRFDNLVDTQQPVAQIVYQRAVAYQALGQIDRALASYDEAIRLNPADPMPLVERGAALARHKGQLSGAIDDFTLALAISPDNVEALMGRGDAYGRSGEFARSLADLDRVIVLAPDNVDVLGTRGLVYLKIGHPELALREYEAALKLDPKRALALYGRGLARIGTGDVKGGNADRAAATLLVADVGQQFVLYGLDK